MGRAGGRGAALGVLALLCLGDASPAPPGRPGGTRGPSFPQAPAHRGALIWGPSLCWGPVVLSWAPRFPHPVRVSPEGAPVDQGLREGPPPSAGALVVGSARGPREVPGSHSAPFRGQRGPRLRAGQASCPTALPPAAQSLASGQRPALQWPPLRGARRPAPWDMAFPGDTPRALVKGGGVTRVRET